MGSYSVPGCSEQTDILAPKCFLSLRDQSIRIASLYFKFQGTAVHFLLFSCLHIIFIKKCSFELKHNKMKTREMAPYEKAR